MTREGRTAAIVAEPAAVRRRVLPFMAVGLASLLLGLWAGLGRIGWPLPVAGGDVLLRHGGLMVVGFVATVIAIERAVAVRTTLATLAPGLSATAGLALLLGLDDPIAPLLALLSALAYLATLGLLERRHRTLPLRVMLAGAACLAAAAAEWIAGRGFFHVVPWWMAFLALTIGGERLDLLRFRRTGGVATFVGIVSLALLFVGPLLASIAGEPGMRVLGVGLALGSGWLLLHDHARRGVRGEGLSRYVAIGLLCAYGWGAFTGAALIAEGLTSGGWHYDAVVHAFFIGVVMSSIFAHEPIIAPSVAGLEIPFTRALYVPLALLEGGLVLRIASDAAGLTTPRAWAGLVQVVAILALLAITIVIVARTRRAVSP